MNERMKVLLKDLAKEAMKIEGTFLVDNVKFTLVEEVLKRSDSIIAASKILGITRTSIHNMKKQGFIEDIKREKGKKVDVEEVCG